MTLVRWRDGSIDRFIGGSTSLGRGLPDQLRDALLRRPNRFDVVSIRGVSPRYMRFKRLSTSSNSRVSEVVVVVEHGEVRSESLDSKVFLVVRDITTDDGLKFDKSIRLFVQTLAIIVNTLFAAIGYVGWKYLRRCNLRSSFSGLSR